MERKGGEDLIISFCGHANILDTLSTKEKLFKALLSIKATEPLTFLLGGYGDFDYIALSCCREYRTIAKQPCLICFVTPYQTETYLKNRIKYTTQFDEIIYPTLESVPPKYAISQRNKWIANNVDILFCYIQHTYGGAYRMFREATKNKKCIVINLFEE